MDNQTRIAKLKEKEYQRLFGVTKAIFEEMLEILEEAYTAEHPNSGRKGGRPQKLSILDRLVIMLGYYRDYRTMDSIAFDYNVAKSTIHDSICWVEETLMNSQKFSLPSKRALIDNLDIEVVLIDATECEIERPQKNNKNTTPARRKDIH